MYLNFELYLNAKVIVCVSSFSLFLLSFDILALLKITIDFKMLSLYVKLFAGFLTYLPEKKKVVDFLFKVQFVCHVDDSLRFFFFFNFIVQLFAE